MPGQAQRSPAQVDATLDGELAALPGRLAELYPDRITVDLDLDTLQPPGLS